MFRNRADLFRLNKSAFDEVIGDPYALEETIGQYITLNTRSSIKVVGDLGVGKATGNPAKPSVVDFFCDVERVIDIGLVLFDQDGDLAELRQRFINTYIHETEPIFTTQERRQLEQIMGRIFMERRIAPVSRYFLTIRRKVA